MPESARKVLHELTAAGLLSSAEVTKFDREIEVGVEALIDRLVTDKRITAYQAEKFLAGQSSDIYFGDYIVLEELGRGGMGTVLLARHRRMDREVAIKILPVSALGSESAIARFYQEVKVAAQLTHPNIVHAYDAGEHHGFHYLVMEYVRGHDLARVLEQIGPIPVALALDYMTQAVQGLEYAHRKGIVHRDIKPSNILLDDEGIVKILDMGLARLGSGIGGAEASLHLTTTGQVMGTVEYMSPEQAEDTRLADARSDIYSLGCTLFRLVTGQAPFARDTVVKTILAHREDPIPDLSHHSNPELARLNNLFQSMVAKNPDDRIQNATLLVQELRRLADDTSFSDAEPASTSAIVDVGVEVVSRGVPSAELPTMYKKAGDDSGIAYTSEVITSQPDSATMPPSSPQASRSIPTPPISSPSQPTQPLVSIAPGSVPRMGTPSAVIRGKRHRGGRLLVLSIFSVLLAPCFVGAILGIVVWVYAQNDLKEIRDGVRDPAGRTLTHAGRVLSIISCVVAVLGMVGWISFIPS